MVQVTMVKDTSAKIARGVFVYLITPINIKKKNSGKSLFSPNKLSEN